MNYCLAIHLIMRTSIHLVVEFTPVYVITATNKFSHRSVPCIFLGYINNHKGFRCFDTLTARLYITGHAQFDEKCFPLANKPQSTPISDLDFSSFMESCISSTGFSPPRKTMHATPAPSMTYSHSSVRPCSLCPALPTVPLAA